MPSRSLLVCLPVLLTFAAGCPIDSPSSGSAGVLDKSGNDTFASAVALPELGGDTLLFEGAVNTIGDVDVYSLGTLEAGDRIIVDAQAVTANLDLTIAVFDPDGEILAFNDDRELDSSDLNPLLDFIIRGQSGEHFLAVAPYSGSSLTGDYTIAIDLIRDVGVPTQQTQTVFLDWDGGSLSSPSLGTFYLEPFDATQVGLSMGQTADLKDMIQAEVEDRYADYNLIVLNSDDDDPPSYPYSAIYFGSDSASAFALAEQIDVMNADLDDRAIIFTRAFQGAFSTTPTLEQMATAMGNTVAHEVGHLLGLVHVEDCNALMDSTCGNNSLLVDQWFKTAVIDYETFPIGWQDAMEFLEFLLGLAI